MLHGKARAGRGTQSLRVIDALLGNDGTIAAWHFTCVYTFHLSSHVSKIIGIEIAFSLSFFLRLSSR